jgi:hypothetical protein
LALLIPLPEQKVVKESVLDEEIRIERRRFIADYIYFVPLHVRREMSTISSPVIIFTVVALFILVVNQYINSNFNLYNSGLLDVKISLIALNT